MKAVIFSINRPHTDNIKIGAKRSELRTRPPKTNEPYKAYIYETLKNGGCGKVIGEFTAFNEFTYRMCMGVPKHLVLSGCLTAEEIWAYTNKGQKDLTDISISDLVIYDEPKELSEFYTDTCDSFNNGICTAPEFQCGFQHCIYQGDIEPCVKRLKRPPQSWCYVERLGDRE